MSEKKPLEQSDLEKSSSKQRSSNRSPERVKQDPQQGIELREMSNSNLNSDMFETNAKFSGNEFESFKCPDEVHMADDLQSHPTTYYEFAETAKTNIIYKKMFIWMKGYEITNREFAGVFYLLISSIFLVILKVVKSSYLPQVSTLNFIFMQGLMGLILTYLCIRQFDLVPYQSNDSEQFQLKVNAFQLLAGFLLFIHSWTNWPSDYSWIMLAVLPLMEISRENAAGLQNSLTRNEFLYFGANLLGIILIYSTLKKTTEPFLGGAFLTAAALICLSMFVHRMRKLRAGNIVSMNITIILIAVQFMPSFFPMQVTTNPDLLQMVVMVLCGFINFVPICLVSRAMQIMRVSTFMIIGSAFVIFKGAYDGLQQSEIDIQMICGIILSLAGIGLVVREVRSKTIMHNKENELPMIHN